MAEFVGDDALQFVAVQFSECAAGDGHGRIGEFEAGGKGVDAAFGVEYVNLRQGNAGGNGHFLHDVDQPPFVRIGRVGSDAPAAQHFGHGRSAFFQRLHFIKAGGENDHDDDHRCEKKKRRIEKGKARQPRPVALRRAGIKQRVSLRADEKIPHQADDQRGDGDDDGHGADKQNHLPPAAFAGRGLPGEKVGRTIGGHRRFVVS